MKNKDDFSVFYFDNYDAIAGIGVIENTTPSKCNLHSHDFYEIEYIEEGEIKYNLNNQIGFLSAGNLFFLTPMDLHSYERIGENFKIITIIFNLEHVDSAIGIHKFNADVLSCNDDLKHMIYLIKKEFESKDKYSAVAMRKILEYILISIGRNQKYSKIDNFPRGIVDVIAYINKNFKEPMDLEFICNKFYYSKAYFCRQFKKYTGVTFVVYLNNLRLVHAKNLLMHTKIPIVELCYECGFGSVRNFIREFKKKYNCTPGQIRKED